MPHTQVMIYPLLWPNSHAPLTDNWKVMEDSSVNFHDMFFFIFCQIIAKNEEKTHHGNLWMSCPQLSSSP